MKILLGQSKYGEIIFSYIKEGQLGTFSGYDLIHPDMSYDGNYYLQDTSSSHSCELVDGQSFKRGDILPENFQPIFEDEEIKEIVESEGYYEALGTYCSECGIFHDTETQYYNLSYTILNDCELYCKTCVQAIDLLTDLNSPEDLFKAKDMTTFDRNIEGFEIVDELFCDSSGFGNEREPALTEKQAKAKVAEILEEHDDLFCGLTHIGQFQVYVTIWKKSKNAKSA